MRALCGGDGCLFSFSGSRIDDFFLCPRKIRIWGIMKAKKKKEKKGGKTTKSFIITVGEKSSFVSRNAHWNFK